MIDIVAEASPASNDPALLRAELDELNAQHDRFRGEVRAAVLKRHRSSEWCLPGSNGALRDLDLSPIEFTYTGTMTYTVDVAVKASNSDTAANLLRDHIAVSSNNAEVTVRDFVSSFNPYQLQPDAPC